MVMQEGSVYRWRADRDEVELMIPSRQTWGRGCGVRMPNGSRVAIVSYQSGAQSRTSRRPRRNCTSDDRHTGDVAPPAPEFAPATGPRLLARDYPRETSARSIPKPWRRTVVRAPGRRSTGVGRAATARRSELVVARWDGVRAVLVRRQGCTTRAGADGATRPAADREGGGNERAGVAPANGAGVQSRRPARASPRLKPRAGGSGSGTWRAGSRWGSCARCWKTWRGGADRWSLHRTGRRSRCRTTPATTTTGRRSRCGRGPTCCPRRVLRRARRSGSGELRARKAERDRVSPTHAFGGCDLGAVGA